MWSPRRAGSPGEVGTGWAGSRPHLGQLSRCAKLPAKGGTLLLASVARVVLAQPGENPWLSLAETPMEELGAGIAWAMWGRPWPGKSEQGAVQAEAGDASPPTGLVSPRALRAEQLP